MRSGQPWIRSFSADFWWILAPPFLVSVVIGSIPEFFSKIETTPPWMWLLIVLGIDVAHVYGTLFRTYLDREERKKRFISLWLIPLMSWVIGGVLYSVNALTFWRAVAYLAVFHFVRQQYGFMRIYSRKEKTSSSFERSLDTGAIYSATLYPLLYWHTHLPRKFNWFVDGDFFSLPDFFNPYLNSIERTGFILFLVIQVFYFLKEASKLIRSPQTFNLPKNLVVLGSAVSWYVGIVLFNGDLTFTIINVVSHGIPYLGLVWFTEQKSA